MPNRVKANTADEIFVKELAEDRGGISSDKDVSAAIAIILGA